MSDITGNDLLKFIVTILILIIIVLVYFTLGGSVLYACKVAQANILPTNTNCLPYTSTPATIESILTNIFITATNPPLSEKLKFPYEEWNKKNYILDMLREYKQGGTSNYLINYFTSLMEGLLSLNYSTLNTIFSYINYLPEPIILFVGPIILSVLFVTLLIVNCLYLIYLWFSNMTWFFKVNKNEDPDKSPKWENVTLWDPLLFMGRCMMMFCFIILFIVMFIFAWGFLPLLSVIWSITSMFSYAAKDEKDKSTGVLTVIANFFKFYKVTITSTLCILIVLSTFANLGITYALAVLVAAVMIFFGVVSTTLFEEIHPKDITPLVSNKQASKSCAFKPKTSGGGLFGGANIKSEILKAGRKISEWK
jgi:hypothetical protein